MLVLVLVVGITAFRISGFDLCGYAAGLVEGAGQLGVKLVCFVGVH